MRKRVETTVTRQQLREAESHAAARPHQPPPQRRSEGSTDHVHLFAGGGSQRLTTNCRDVSRVPVDRSAEVTAGDRPVLASNARRRSFANRSDTVVTPLTKFAAISFQNACAPKTGNSSTSTTIRFARRRLSCATRILAPGRRTKSMHPFSRRKSRTNGDGASIRRRLLARLGLRALRRSPRGFFPPESNTRNICLLVTERARARFDLSTFFVLIIRKRNKRPPPTTAYFLYNR